MKTAWTPKPIYLVIRNDILRGVSIILCAYRYEHEAKRVAHNLGSSISVQAITLK